MVISCFWFCVKVHHVQCFFLVFFSTFIYLFIYIFIIIYSSVLCISFVDMDQLVYSCIKFLIDGRNVYLREEIFSKATTEFLRIQC